MQLDHTWDSLSLPKLTVGQVLCGVLVRHGLDIIQEVKNLTIEFFARCAGELLMKPRACVDGQGIPPCMILMRQRASLAKSDTFLPG